MKILSLSFKNLKKRPNEDFYLISREYQIFTVADGVSRIKNRAGVYPKPSGAKLAAEEFCKAVITYLEKNYKNANLKTLGEALDLANHRILNLNEKYGINKKLDYLENDYFSACGIASFIKNNIFYYGYVGDCGIRIYDKNGFLKLVSIDDIAALEDWRDGQKFKSEEERWLIWRKFLRNKSKAPYLTYGVFTGEPEVKHYYHLEKTKLNSGDLVFLYSDGFSHFIKRPQFRQLFKVFKGKELEQKINELVETEIRKNPGKETTEQFGDDKTLIAILF